MGGGALLRRSSDSTGVLPSYPLLAGVVGPFSVLAPPNPGWRPFALTPGSTGALAALLRLVGPHALALSFALSVGGVSCSGGLLRRSSNPTGVLPAIHFWQELWGPLRFYLHIIQVGVPSRPLLVVLVFSRSFDRWYLTHWRCPQRSRSVVSWAVALYSASLGQLGCPPSFSSR